MAVLPGSLDYLYHNGILDHIPYEAYQMSPMTPSGSMQMAGLGTGYGINPMGGAYGAMPQINGSQYLQAAQLGHLYNTYNHQDTFIRRNNDVNQGEGFSVARSAYGIGDGQGVNADYESMAFGEEGKGFRQSIKDAAEGTKNAISNSPNWVKGILAGGIMIGTLCLLFKGKKPTPPVASKSGFSWSKLNPVNWIKAFKK